MNLSKSPGTWYSKLTGEVSVGGLHMYDDAVFVKIGDWQVVVA
jgi:hypothetical protein